ncbi:MAG TPA: GlyGly-CTERM sorting domain-containing protein [Gammaproteobacteria bacterium]|jgi:hypothetical protein
MHKALGRAALLLVALCLPALATTSSSLQWTWRNPLPSPDTFTVIASGGGVYVAAGLDGVIYSSPDGVTWTADNSPLGMGSQYLDALYANGNFLLAGVDPAGNPHVSTSSDGVTWTDAKLTFNPDFASVGVQPILHLGFGNGTYVVLGAEGGATSTDATTWTAHGASFIDDSILNPIVFASGVFIKDGIANSANADSPATIYFSSNGANWTASSVDQDGALATDGTTFFMFLADGSAVYTSTDGDNWSKQIPTGSVPERHNEVLWDGTQFLTLGNSSQGEYSYSSPDGLAWTRLGLTQMPFTMALHSITAVGTTYTSVGTGPLQVFESTDFITWHLKFSGTSGPYVAALTDMIYAGGRFVAVGQTPQRHPAVMESSDGSSWTAATLPDAISDELTTVAFGKGLYVAASPGKWFTSPDAVSWSVMTDAPGTPQTDLAYGNGTFVAFLSACSSGCTAATSSDGKTWTTNAAAHAGTLAFDGTRFVSVGNALSYSDKAPVYTSCDGVTWSHSADIGVSQGATFSRIRAVSNGLVALGASVVATTEDSSHWTAHDLGDSSANFTDVAFAGSAYYALDGNRDSARGTFYTSTDASNWTSLSGSPVASSPDDFGRVFIFNSLATDGTHLVSVGDGGDIISASVPGDAITTAGSTCTALPSIDSVAPVSTPKSSGGSLDLLTLAGLFSLLVLRRRA